MRKTFIITLILFLLFVATGFERIIGGRTEMENTFLITIVGIDETKDDNVKLTIVTKLVSSGEENSTDDKKHYTSEGRTIFEANRNFESFMEKDIFWGHIDIILISEEAVKTNINSYLDFFIRDHENRLNSVPIIVRGSTSEELIKTVNKSTEDITDKIKMMLDSSGGLSISSKTTIVEVLRTLDNQYSSTYIPSIRLEQEENPEEDKPNAEKEGNDEEETAKLVLDGYAIFDQETADFTGFINGKMARGFNWIIDEIKSGVIVVEQPKGEKISLEIIDSATEIIPEFKDNKWNITVRVKMSSNICEQQGTTNIYNKKDLEEINKKQKQIIEKEIQDIINFAKDNNVDIFNINKVIRNKYPHEWEKTKVNWRQVFQEINFDIKVDSKINRVYVIKEPIMSKEDEKND